MSQAASGPASRQEIQTFAAGGLYDPTQEHDACGLGFVAQIKGIGGEHPVFRGKGLLLSIPDAIAWVLEQRYLKDEVVDTVSDLAVNRCPDCGEKLVFQEGCLICPACGFSRCG